MHRSFCACEAGGIIPYLVHPYLAYNSFCIFRDPQLKTDKVPLPKPTSLLYFSISLYLCILILLLKTCFFHQKGTTRLSLFEQKFFMTLKSIRFFATLSCNPLIIQNNLQQISRQLIARLSVTFDNK